MAGNIYSDFQIGECFIREFILHRPAFFEDTLSLLFGYKARIMCGIRADDRDTRFGVMSLSFKLTESEDIEGEDSDNETFSASIFAQASFTIPASVCSEEYFIDMLKRNGAATMIPIVRAYMHNALALMGAPPYIVIPNINVLSIEDWEVEKYVDETEV